MQASGVSFSSRFADNFIISPKLNTGTIFLTLAMSQFFLLLDINTEDRFPGHVRAAILKYNDTNITSLERFQAQIAEKIYMNAQFNSKIKRYLVKRKRSVFNLYCSLTFA